jgi:hypothetical protein
MDNPLHEGNLRIVVFGALPGDWQRPVQSLREQQLTGHARSVPHFHVLVYPHHPGKSEVQVGFHAMPIPSSPRARESTVGMSTRAEPLGRVLCPGHRGSTLGYRFDWGALPTPAVRCPGRSRPGIGRAKWGRACVPVVLPRLGEPFAVVPLALTG